MDLSLFNPARFGEDAAIFLPELESAILKEMSVPDADDQRASSWRIRSDFLPRSKSCNETERGRIRELQRDKFQTSTHPKINPLRRSDASVTPSPADFQAAPTSHRKRPIASLCSG
jgi:hypothetical protein